MLQFFKNRKSQQTEIIHNSKFIIHNSKFIIQILSTQLIKRISIHHPTT